MNHLRSLLLLFVVAAMGCDSSRETSSVGNAPVSFGATLTKSTGIASGYSPSARLLPYGNDVTITSVKVVLASIDIRGQGTTRAARATDDGMRPVQRKDLSDAGGRMGDRDRGAGVKSANDVDFPGPFVWDLTNQTVMPSLEAVSVPTGVYRQLDLTLLPLTAGEAQGLGLAATDPVVGHSYVIEGYFNHVTYGTVTDGTVKLVIFGDQARTFHVGLHQGIEITADSVNDILLIFSADGWFPASLVGQLRAGLNSGDVTVGASGAEPVVYLDANRNMAIASQFHRLFHSSMKVAKDVNRDQKFDNGEFADEVTSGE